MVRDPEGKPRADAIVSAEDRSSGFRNETQTAGDGSYTLMLARGTHDLICRVLNAQLPPQRRAGIRVDGPRDFDLQLQRGVALTVELVDEEGGGIRAGMLELSRRVCGPHPFGQEVFFFGEDPTLRIATSDGVARIESVGPDVFTLRVLSLPEPYPKPDLSSVPVFSDTTVRIVVPPGLAVSGVVHGAPFHPGAITQLCFLPAGAGATCVIDVEDGGYYQGHLPAGRLDVVHRSRFTGTSSRVQLVGRILVERDEISDFQADPGVEVIGRLSTPGPTLQTGMEVYAHSPETGVAA